MLREPPLSFRLNPADDVVIACRELEAGTNHLKEGVVCKERIPAGHKVATRAVAKDEPVRRYSQIIGFATQPIAPGQHVHVHNLEVREFARDYRFGEAYKATEFVPAPATFRGIVRPDGRVATRNYIGILSTVNCSATVAKYVADAFKGEALAGYPNVDGVVALTHTSGCGMDTAGGGLHNPPRPLPGDARPPKFAGGLRSGVGGGAKQMGGLFFPQGLAQGPVPRPMTIQGKGGPA